VKKIEKIFSLLILFSLLLTSCGSVYTDDGLPIVDVDEAHRQEQGNNNYDAVYKIPAGPGFALDLLGYNFKVPESLGITEVNMIQISFGDGFIYAIPVQKDQTLYRVTADTVLPLGDSQPFTGLTSGDNITVGIGYWDKDQGLYIMWYGYIEVQ
jgi:hypothetical protein